MIAVKAAFKGTIVRLFIFYMLSIALMLAIVPWRQSGTGESPFLMAMNVIHLPAAAGIFNFIVLVAALSAMNSQLYITTRMMFRCRAPVRRRRRWARQPARHSGQCAGDVVYRHRGLYRTEPGGAGNVVRRHDVYLGVWRLLYLADDFRHPPVLPPPAPADPPEVPHVGIPYTTLLGAGLMAALMISTAFTEFFHMTLWFGIPFTLLLVVAYHVQSRRAAVPSPFKAPEVE